MTVAPAPRVRTRRSCRERVYELNDHNPITREPVDWQRPTRRDLERLPDHIRDEVIATLRQGRWHEPLTSDIDDADYCTEVQYE